MSRGAVVGRVVVAAVIAVLVALVVALLVPRAAEVAAGLALLVPIIYAAFAGMRPRHVVVPQRTITITGTTAGQSIRGEAEETSDPWEAFGRATHGQSEGSDPPTPAEPLSPVGR